VLTVRNILNLLTLSTSFPAVCGVAVYHDVL